MRWVAAAARFAVASAATYALLSVGRSLYLGLLCLVATPVLQFLSGLPHTLSCTAGSVVLARAHDGRVPLGELPFLIAEWSIYLGLCAASWRASAARPVRVVGGLGVLLFMQWLTLLTTAMLLSWRRGMPGLSLVESVHVVALGVQRVAPVALWWLQFAAEAIPWPTLSHRERRALLRRSR
ncbi:MAG TPA: hypothetical protein VMS93_02865 [Candidatus Saccharimonadales bacterium]|nr:hypothetical protein [Candidatus Saccharimonadales bacterium]